jgi:hypothetical protein
MKNNAKIVVKQGGKLIVDGGTITTEDSQLWQGIQVWGNRTAHQHPDADGNYQQGYLELKNGATIENALIAVDLWNPVSYSQTGGMVYATDAVFRNNAKAVHALYYRNFHPYNPSLELPYNSNFKDCTFEITDDYLGDATFYKHVDLAHVNGIDFQGCDFSLAENVAGASTWTHAIAAYDARFRVDAYCTSTQNPCPDNEYNKCTFTGFWSAVYAADDGSTIQPFSVSRAVFNNNANGVRTIGVKNATVLFSDFEIGHLWFCGAGIYADHVTGFAFEENTFSKYSGGPVSDYFGILINNSNAVNEVYKNTFNGVSYANFADGKNWPGKDKYLGLAYHCNENTDNYADFYVADDTTALTGVQSFQGNDNHVAGNTFSQSNNTWHFYNGGDHLVGYYYNVNEALEVPQIPDKIHQVAAVAKNLCNTCPSHYGGIGTTIVLTAQQKLDAEQEYIDNLANYNSVKTLYDSYVDGGDTEGEILDIQTAQPDDMWALRTQLLGESPHLSEEVLKEAADKSDVFTESVLFDILAANPDELKNEELLEYLENKDEPLPAYMIDILRQLASGITYKTILQQEMAAYSQQYTRAANDIIRSILNEDDVDYVELRSWLDNLGGITSDWQIISSYIYENNFTDAFALANLLPGLYDMDDDELIEHGYYMDMLNLYQTLHQQGRNTFQLTAAEKTTIESIGANSKGIAQSQAIAILESVYADYSYVDCPVVDGAVGYKNSNVGTTELNTVYGLSITVKPNPASQWAAFDYTLPAGYTSATICISDLSGKTIEQMHVKGAQGQQLWDTRNIKPGVYLYTLKVEAFSQSGKIIISR